MSQWDPNDPNNPYNQQQQWGQQPQQGQNQQGHGQQQQWDQQQGQQQQQWGQQPQQQQWDPNQQQQQQQWDPNQQQQQQQWDPNQQQAPQQQWDPNQAQQQQWDPNQQQAQQYQQQGQQQTWGQQAQGAYGGQQPAMQAAGFGNAGFQGAYNETFGDPSKSEVGAVATLGVNERVSFLRKTYAHLFGAIAVFAALEFALLHPKSPLFEAIAFPIVKLVFTSSQFVWLGFLAAFVAVGWVAERWAQSEDAGKGKQYMGLGLYVLAEAIIFIPLLWAANYYQQKFSPGFNIIAVSGIITMAVFAGLTATVFITKKDFSFMRGALSLGAMAAMGLIVASIFFGFNLGIVFSAAMLLLAGGYVLYYTSKVLHYYRPGQHVAASLALFAAVALMFWYVIRIVMELAGR